MKVVKLSIDYIRITNDLAKRWYLVELDNRHIPHREDGPAETWFSFDTLRYDHFFRLYGREADAPLDWEKNKSYTGGLVPF